MVRSPSFDSYNGNGGGGAAESVTFPSDSEKYDEVPEMFSAPPKDKGKVKLGRGNSLSLGGLSRANTGLTRGNTITGTKKSTASSKWGPWGKNKGAQEDTDREQEEQPPLAIYKGPVRRDSRSTQASRSTQRSQDSEKTVTSMQTGRETRRSNSSRSIAPKPRPPLMPQDSTSTLVGSAFERKVNDKGSIREKPDTTERVDELRKLMAKDNLDY
jgi:Xaa-Pro aminopeptidase